jgi:pyridoxamine 5'-phosphate oxidase
MAENESIAALRREYMTSELLESNIDSDPYRQFHLWFDQSVKAELPEPNAMCLSTVHKGRPESRIVLLKSIADEGFIFFTNYHSSKGRDIEENKHVCLNFVWLELERQVRINGVAEKISEEENDKYFYSRPVSSQIGAIISEQSGLLGSRLELENAMEEALQKYASVGPVRPAHWGGYIVKPDMLEFWQGRSSRLHDRLRYDLVDGSWKISRLFP